MMLRLNSLLKSWQFIGWGSAIVLVWGIWAHGIDVLVRTWPPYQTTSLVVITAHGVPAQVIETRRIISEFNGAWRVLVVSIDRNEDFCYLPPTGPVKQRYRPTDRPTFTATWLQYTADGDLECMRRMQAVGGLFHLETRRTMSVLGRDVDLPVVVSAPFEVW
jgi:hypothetical protein